MSSSNADNWIGVLNLLLYPMLFQTNPRGAAENAARAVVRPHDSGPSRADCIRAARQALAWRKDLQDQLPGMQLTDAQLRDALGLLIGLLEAEAE